MDLSNITVNAQSSIRIAGEKIIYFDPFNITDENRDADIIFISHEHFDHFQPESIAKVKNENTVIVAPASMKKQAAEFIVGIKPKAVIPTHYGDVVGSPTDGAKFKELVESADKSIQVELRL